MNREPMEMNLHITLRLLLILTVALTYTACTKESKSMDSKLAALQAELDAAQTQAGMNEKSLEISQHLDRKLAKLEDLVRSDLHDAELEGKFNNAAAVWREYRDAQSSIVGELYREGSVQPMICNETFTKLTEGRIAGLLVAMGPEILLLGGRRWGVG